MHLGLLDGGVMEVLGVLATVFWIWMLVDCATREPNRQNKILWLVVIALTHVLGAVIYFVVRRQGRVSRLRV